MSYDDDRGLLRVGVVTDDTSHAFPVGTTLLGLLQLSGPDAQVPRERYDAHAF